MPGNWFPQPTEIELALTGLVLPLVAAILTLDATAGLAFFRRLAARPGLAARVVFFGDLGLLAATTAFLVLASRIPYGFLGWFQVFAIAALLKYLYEGALLALLPPLASVVAPGATGRRRRSDRAFRWLSVLSLLLFTLLLVATGRVRNPEGILATAFVLLLVLPLVLVAGVGLHAAAVLPRRIRASGADPAVIPGAIRLARLAWFHPATWLLLPLIGLVDALGEVQAATGAAAAISGAMGIVLPCLFVAFPSLGVLGAAGALWYATRGTGAKKRNAP